MIQEGMRRHQIYPNVHARGLHRKAHQSIGLAMGLSDNFFFLEFLGSFIEEARSRSCRLVVHSFQKDQAENDNNDGVIVQAGNENPEMLAALDRSHVPIVIAGNVPLGDYHIVAADDKANMYNLAMKILEKVDKKSTSAFVYLPPFNYSVNQRIDGYQQALRDSNQTPRGAVWKFSGMEEMSTYFKSQSRLPRVIMAANDFTALKIINSLKDNGIQVPDKVMVSGYDNVSFVRDLGFNFPTVDLRMSNQAKAIFDLLAALGSGDAGKPRQHLISGEIVI